MVIVSQRRRSAHLHRAWPAIGRLSGQADPAGEHRQRDSSHQYARGRDDAEMAMQEVQDIPSHDAPS